MSCEFRASEASWPTVVGEYVVLDETASVAVSTLANIELPEQIAQRMPNGLAIVGKTETENIGIDKVIKNIITSPTIRFLIIAGNESHGHLTGETMISLIENGVDESRKVIGSRGKRPILRNVTRSEIQRFREQVQIIDMIGCNDADEIAARIEELWRERVLSCGCSDSCGQTPISDLQIPRVAATQLRNPVKMDSAGYFVVVPLAERSIIHVEHYAYDNSLLRIIEGHTARSIYDAIIDGEWVTELESCCLPGQGIGQSGIITPIGLQVCPGWCLKRIRNPYPRLHLHP